MGKLNVTQFAAELGLPITLLLEQLKAAGVNKEQESDSVSEKDKAQLLEHLRQAHGAEKPAKKITLTRRETTEIKKADSSGRARTIQVEVRKRRVVAPVAATEAAAPPVALPKGEAAQVLGEQELAAREEEARLQAELAARQAAEAQAKQERSKRKTTTKKAVEPEPKPVAPAVKEAATPVVAAPVVDLAEGTLHKPAPKPGDKIAKPVKKPKAEAKASPWDEKGHKKRTPLKTGEKTGV
ncbi:MAG TPA: translation initiation factor IF-2 associated domain-containing protein, partial [Gallionella sp.]|nr:translation initiation factor IF-2 associated domain-containing protein [Gallionella sp.]